MVFTDENQLMQNIKSAYLYRVYLLYGEEKYLKDAYTSRLTKLAVSENFKEFNFHIFDGNNLNMDSLIESCEALPFMAQQKCVLVKKFDYESLGTNDKNKFDDLLKDPPESTVLILIVDNPLNPKKSTKAKKLLDLCSKAGVVAELQKRAASDVVKFLRSRAERRNCSLTKELSEYLLARCGNNMLSLSNELDKIIIYTRASNPDNVDSLNVITKQTIDAVTSKAISASIYDLAKEILAFRFEKAMQITKNLLYLKYEPISILASLSGAYIDLYVAKIAKNSSKGEADIKENFAYAGREFLIRSSLRDCSKFKTEVLRKSIAKLAEVDYRMKSSRADDQTILEQTITELFLIANS